MVEKARVLVVDDDRDICETLRDILEIEDYSVRLALDGQAALGAVAEESFDVVLMDIKMPVLDGVETFRRMHVAVPGLPVIMLTAYALEDRIRAALDNGAYAAMRKPVQIEALLELIGQARRGAPPPPRTASMGGFV